MPTNGISHYSAVKPDCLTLSVIWKSDLFNKIKCSFFQTVVVSILLYGCTTWTLTKCMKKKLNDNCTKML